MKLKHIAVSLLMMAATMTAAADAIMTVNGNPVEKTPVSLVPDGNQVSVEFDDNTVVLFPMEQIAVTFSTPTGLGSVATFGKLSVNVGNTLEVAGIAPGCTLQVFDVKGRLVAQAKADADVCTVNISAIEPGVYILRVGKEIVKFVKR